MNGSIVDDAVDDIHVDPWYAIVAACPDEPHERNAPLAAYLLP